MELKGSKTEQNLWTAFAGESQARVKYAYYADQARKDGYGPVSYTHLDVYKRQISLLV